MWKLFYSLVNNTTIQTQGDKMWKLFYSLVNNTTIQKQGDKDVEIILQFGKQYYHPNTGRHIYTYQDFDEMEEKTF